MWNQAFTTRTTFATDNFIWEKKTATTRSSRQGESKPNLCKDKTFSEAGIILEKDIPPKKMADKNRIFPHLAVFLLRLLEPYQRLDPLPGPSHLLSSSSPRTAAAAG